MREKLNPLAFGYAGAIVSAVAMLLLGVLGRLGLYMSAVNMMQQWHMFFRPSFLGIIGGMIEAAIISFVFMYAIALTYNKFA